MSYGICPIVILRNWTEYVHHSTSWFLRFSCDIECNYTCNMKGKYDKSFYSWGYLPNILEMLELCISGHAFKIFRRSSLAQIINAFMGRLIWGASVLSFRDCLIILAPNIFASTKLMKIGNEFWYITPQNRNICVWTECLI